MPGWLTEWIKTEDMSDGASEDSSRSIRLRFINPEEVIVEQCLLFLKGGDQNGQGGTLSGNKLLVYVIMKILKKCTLLLLVHCRQIWRHSPSHYNKGRIKF